MDYPTELDRAIQYAAEIDRQLKYAAGEIIGSGRTGEVYRNGDMVTKSALINSIPTAEGEVYELLGGYRGIAPGYRHGSSIHLPFYPHVLSVDTVAQDRRKGYGAIIKKGFADIVSAVAAMSEHGVVYNDPLQVAFDSSRLPHLVDFSNAQLGHDRHTAYAENLGALATYLSQFGASDQAAAIQRVSEGYADARAFADHGDPAWLSDWYSPFAAKVARQLGHSPPTHAYYGYNARHVGLPDVGQTEPPPRGVKVVLTRRPLQMSEINHWELIPVIHPPQRREAT